MHHTIQKTLKPGENKTKQHLLGTAKVAEKTDLCQVKIACPMQFWNRKFTFLSIIFEYENVLPKQINT
jgi:hypothetical protein